MTKIKGIIAAMQTAMHEDGSINEGELRRQINRQIGAGVDGVFCMGTNGEFFVLSAQEKIRIMEIFVEEVKGRVPVYAGTGCIGTQETVDLSRKAGEIGVDVLSVITPYFAAISQEELYRHYAAVAEAVNLPVVMYNIPSRTGVSLAPKTVSRLAKDFPNMVGVKDSSGDIGNIRQYIRETQGLDFAVLCGHDPLILETLIAGGRGGITAIANILPTVLVDIYQNYLKGDMERAREAQNAIGKMCDCVKYGNPNTVLKYAANLIGQPVGPCRKPFDILPQEAVEGIRKTIDTYYADYKNI